MNQDEPAPEPERIAVAFGRLLRGAGLDVPPSSVLTFVQALAAVGLDRRDSVYWAARATLVRRPEDVPLFDAAFRSFFERQGLPVSLAAARPVPITVTFDDAEDAPAAGDQEPDRQRRTLSVRWSPRELLRNKDFAYFTSAEFDEARKLMADMRLAGSLQRSLRLRKAIRSGSRPDVRTTVKRALRAGGEPMRRAWLEPSDRPRRIVLLCDVSGSMDPYARAFLRFLHAAVAGRTRVEAFAFGTRLTRLTRELRSRNPDEALARASRAVADWSGGTRLGEGIRAFNDTWGVRGMARGAIVVILSDGWDRGDPEALAEQMARLKLVAHKVVWVNPLKAAPGYAPLARGMAAALPFVDEFVEGHSLASLEALVEVVGGKAPRRGFRDVKATVDDSGVTR